MAIQIDSAGFLVGERKLTDINKGIKDVNNDTSQILKIIGQALNEDFYRFKSNDKHLGKINSSISNLAKAKTTINVTVNTTAGQSTKTVGRNTSVNTKTRTINSSNKPSQSTSQTRTTTNRPYNGANGANGTSGSATKDASTERLRDSSGRFVGSAGSATEKGFLDAVRRGINSSHLGMNADTSNIDPNLDALRELYSVVSPARKAFGLMGRGAMWLYRRGKPKKNEDIPSDLKEHNDEVERHNFEERKILKKILDELRKSKGGLFGALGSMLPSGRRGRNGRNGRNGRVGGAASGRDRDRDNRRRRNGDRDRDNRRPPDTNENDNSRQKGKGLLGRLAKRLPFVGALVTGGMLASEWSDSSNGDKGAGIGSMIGTGLGGAIGALAGGVGAFGGAAVGSVIGDKIGRKVGEWTGSLQAQDIGGTIVNGWKSTLNGIDKFVKNGFNKLMGYGGMMGGFGGGMGGFGGGMMLASFRRGGSGGYGGGYSGGYSGGSGGVDAGLSGGTPSDYNPDNEIPIVKVLKTGKGYNVVELADGSVIHQKGNWNWRNRNVGNIEDGDYSKANGRVDQSGAEGTKASKRFAAFPTIAAGRAAKHKLLFEGKNYRNLSLTDAIARYAPKHENNTKAYQQHVLRAVGGANKKMKDFTPAERELIKKAIVQKEGKLTGKVTVIKPPTHQYNPTKNTGTPAQQSTQTPTNKQMIVPPLNPNKPKQMFVSGNAQVAGRTNPLYVSNSRAVKPVKISDTPSQFKRLDSGGGRKDAPLMASQTNISQDVGDRDIAHALRGGLGTKVLMG